MDGQTFRKIPDYKPKEAEPTANSGMIGDALSKWQSKNKQEPAKKQVIKEKIVYKEHNIGNYLIPKRMKGTVEAWAIPPDLPKDDPERIKELQQYYEDHRLVMDEPKPKLVVDFVVLLIGIMMGGSMGVLLSIAWRIIH